MLWNRFNEIYFCSMQLTSSNKMLVSVCVCVFERERVHKIPTCKLAIDKLMPQERDPIPYSSSFGLPSLFTTH